MASMLLDHLVNLRKGGKFKKKKGRSSKIEAAMASKSGC